MLILLLDASVAHGLGSCYQQTLLRKMTFRDLIFLTLPLRSRDRLGATTMFHVPLSANVSCLAVTGSCRSAQCALLEAELTPFQGEEKKQEQCSD